MQAQLLLLADGMHCRRLRDLCLGYLQRHFGAMRRCAVALPPRDVRALSGYERLPSSLRDEVHWAVYGHSRAPGGAASDAGARHSS